MSDIHAIIKMAEKQLNFILLSFVFSIPEWWDTSSLRCTREPHQMCEGTLRYTEILCRKVTTNSNKFYMKAFLIAIAVTLLQPTEQT